MPVAVSLWHQRAGVSNTSGLRSSLVPVTDLELCLCRKLKCKSSEGQREDLLLLVVDPGPGGPEGLVDLLYGRRDVRTVEVKLAVTERDRFSIVATEISDSL